MSEGINCFDGNICLKKGISECKSNFTTAKLGAFDIENQLFGRFFSL